MAAEQDALEILTTSWQRQDGTMPVPVDPIAIARKLGVRVYTAGLESNVSGMLFMRAGADPEIYLSEHDSYNRQRFTCAHELGHWRHRVLAGEQDARVVDLRGPLAARGVDSQEIYANQFAASLLMPKDEVQRLHRGGYSPLAIADRLRVSADAATFRVKNLGLV